MGIMKILEINDYDYDQDTFAITWEVTKNCSYKCRYCSIHDPNSIASYPEKIINIISYLNKIRKVKLTFFGGEPTDHPNFKEILLRLKKVNQLELYTNLSKSISYYQGINRIVPSIYLETSFHPSRSNFDTYLNKVVHLNKIYKRIICYLMLDTSYINSYKEQYNLLVQSGVETRILRVSFKDQTSLSTDMEEWCLSKGYGLGEKFSLTQRIRLTYEDKNKIKYLETDLNFLRKNNLTNFKLFKCWCGKKNIFISQDGGIYPCLDYYLNKENPFATLSGDIEADMCSVKEIIAKPVVCKMDNCTSELSVPKKRILFRN